MRQFYHCKLSRNNEKNAEEWMDHLRLKAKEVSYQEQNRQLKGKFINGINDDMITSEIIKELIATKTPVT